jgi:hypothetical protein
MMSVSTNIMAYILNNGKYKACQDRPHLMCDP